MSRRWIRLAVWGTIGVLLQGSIAAALQVSGLEAPHSFLADPVSNSYFISNINGESEARDNNGFITKLSDDGRITAFKFIEGGRGDVTLHAPKGMAVVDHVLYVTDLDTLRAFDKTTGKPLSSVMHATNADSPSLWSMWPPMARAICISPICSATPSTAWISHRHCPSHSMCPAVIWPVRQESPCIPRPDMSWWSVIVQENL